MKNILHWLTGLSLLLSGGIAAADDLDHADLNLPPKIFAQPDRIRYDGHCLTIDGQDVVIFSGAFHYFRCPKPLWRERFQKIKDAGFNAVETYTPWNWHERDQPAGLDDYSKVDLTDLKDWLKMAHDEFGLYTIIRPGPYICAEWDGGGYPRWLLNLKPAAPKRPAMWLRSDDPLYLAWEKHWYNAVIPVIAPEQLTRKPKGGHGVILFQIENEYDYDGGAHDERINHLRSLYQCAKDNGIDVPIMTCWTREIRGSHDPLLSQVFDGCNDYPRWGVTTARNDVMKEKAEQPNAPGMVPELQGGWFSQVGGILSEDQEGVTAPQINAITLMAYAGGATITSYYMLYGGLNSDGWEARSLTTSYDYNAPIREPGGVGDRYYAVKAIGNMLKKHGPELARADLVKATCESTNCDLDFTVRRNPDGQTFVFCFNKDRKLGRTGEAVLKPAAGDPITVKYDLPPFGMKVLCLPSGEWQPEAVPNPERPAAPAPVRLATALTHPETASQGWRPVKAGDSLAALGVYDTRYVLYRSHFTLTPEQLTSLPTLQLNLFCADSVVVSVNGRLLQNYLAGDHTKHFDAANGDLLRKAAENQKVIRLDLSGALQAGDNDIVLLYENAGQSNGGKGMEDLGGLKAGELSGPIPAGIPLVNWRAKRVDDDGLSLCGADVDDSAWSLFTLLDTPEGDAGHILDYQSGATAVFRATLNLTAADLHPGTMLRFESIDDSGVVFVNGHEVGRSTSWSEPFTADVTTLLKPGANSIAVAVRNEDGIGGLTKPARLSADPANQLPLAWEISPQLDGVAARWYAPSADVSGWNSVDLVTNTVVPVKEGDMPSAPADSLATWYRLTFTLPDTTGAWVPWGVVLQASGNGWIYLNDQPLGRYWEAGPQRKFWLPECYLNTAPGATNVLTLMLRPTDKGAKLTAAEVQPYADQIEKQ